MTSSEIVSPIVPVDASFIELAEKFSSAREYVAGQTIIVEGEPGSTMLFVLSGVVKIFKSSTTNNAKVLIGRRGEGEFLGEMALVEELPRSASVVAETDCKVLEFSRESFEKIIQEQPTLATRVLSSLSNKLRESDHYRIEELEESNRLLESSNKELVRLNTFLDCVIDQSPTATFLATRDGKIYRLNKAATAMFELDHPDGIVELDNLFADFRLSRFLQGNQTVWHGEVHGLRGGHEFPAYLSVSSLTGHNDSILHLVICQDISELHTFNKVAAELERYESAKESAIEMSHDLKNLLGVLLGNVELMVSRMDDAQCRKHEHIINTIKNSSDETMKFIEETMSYREDPRGRQHVDIRAVLRAIIRFCKSQGKFRNIELHLDIDPRFPTTLYLAEGQIQSAIVNLLVNAAEALSEKNGDFEPKISITLGLDKNMVTITVSDNGPGINPEQQSKLFRERFTTKPKGHGIGLVSIGKIMQKHGGEVTVESKPGKGATFTLRLPADSETEHA